MESEEFQIKRGTKAGIVSIVCDQLDFHKTEEDVLHSLEELKDLLKTLDIEVVSTFMQKKKHFDAGTMLGSGKVEEIGIAAKEAGVDFLVFDFELSGSQLRNIKKISGLDVIDRVSIILEIFASHARSREAKIQIEIYRLEYLLPRLAAFWTHFSRQRAVRGTVGGEGEQQIELDRRMIRRRIEFLKKELSTVLTARKEQKKKREKSAITAALVGYTNAGKSSIMNRLCQENVLEENKLFATLDSTFRMLNPDSKPPMILVDTVGFISNLPNTLIEGFKTTLESAIDADLLIIVCDVSDPKFTNQLRVTNEVLAELGVEEKERIIVFNKKDKVNDLRKIKIATREYDNCFTVSSFDPEDMKELKEFIVNFFLSKQTFYDLFVPYEEGPIHATIAGKTNVMNRHFHENGTFYRVRVPEFMLHALRLNKYLLAPHHKNPFIV